MTALGDAALRQLALRALAQHAGAAADADALAAAARRAYDDLAVALAPLISTAGVDALIARALHLAQREYPSDHAGEDQAGEPLGQISLWLERQDPPVATDAAVAMFAAFAALLAALIGEPLTARYLRKAWPESFSETMAEGTSA